MTKETEQKLMGLFYEHSQLIDTKFNSANVFYVEDFISIIPQIQSILSEEKKEKIYCDYDMIGFAKYCMTSPPALWKDLLLEYQKQKMMV